MSQTKCRAKDPSTCKVHGLQADVLRAKADKPQFALLTAKPGTLSFDGTRSQLQSQAAKEAKSPYANLDENDWQAKTLQLISKHPLSTATLRDAVLQSWDAIFESNIGPAKIGQDIKPTATVMGYLLHEIIPVMLAKNNPGWQRDIKAGDKDLVYVQDPKFSIEIKTSSHPTQVFGNRSFDKKVAAAKAKKEKSGYYLAVNFESWDAAGSKRPAIKNIRFGWIDQTDWVAQASETGQSARLVANVYKHQLATLA